MPITVHNGNLSLADSLLQKGMRLDMGCAGTGRCGRCKVMLLDGTWEIRGTQITVDEKPIAAMACQARLLSPTAHIQLIDNQGGPQIQTAWRTAPLPCTDETVIAVDIGTTTVAAAIIAKGAIASLASDFNLQNSFGDNVITRVSHAATGQGLAELQHAVVSTINALLSRLAGVSGASRIAIAGNTVMCCLLHGIDPSSIGTMPFTPPCTEFPLVKGAKLGLCLDAPVLTVPAIAGYIGGDITAGLGEIVLQPGEMLVDIGTNCEIAINNGKAIYCTAAAAGPAFEGAGIASAARATSGAIDHINGDFSFSTISAILPPIGICGSALVDFLAIARKKGILTKMGRYASGESTCRLADGIAISEKDIEQLLKAKAAVFAGITTMAEYANTHIDKIILAGGFAEYIDTGNASAINMLPCASFAKIGNSSLAGAARLAVEPAHYGRLLEISHAPEVVHLNNIPQFEDNFIDALFLP